jgi:hypothetical protein
MMMIPPFQKPKQQSYEPDQWGRKLGSNIAQQRSPWNKMTDVMKRIGNQTPGQQSPWALAARRAKRRMQGSPMLAV